MIAMLRLVATIAAAWVATTLTFVLGLPDSLQPTSTPSAW